MSKFHPLLLDLGLVTASDASNSSDNSAPSALRLLHHLLETKAVTPQVVQSAFQTLYNGSKPCTSAARCSTGDQSDANTTSPGTKSARPARLAESNTTPGYRTRHIALQFYYDGSKFSGLAQNMGSESDQSVEKALFSALMKTRLVQSRETSGYSRCGRTDKGVSSAGQVVALHLKSAISISATMDQNGRTPIPIDLLPKNALDHITAWVPPKKGTGPRTQKDVTEYSYAKMLNNVLPDTIRVLGWSPVSSEFSARFSATTRTYRYFFVRRHLNLEKMSQALQCMVGRHDFRNFCKMDVEKVYNFERQIHSAKIVVPASCGGRMEDAVCHLKIVGQAFLWHQIRCIVSILFLVGQELECPSVVNELLNVTQCPGKPGYPLAAELPLVLHRCGYPNLRIGYSVQNLFSVCSQLEQKWEDLVLAAARVRNCINSLKDAQVTTLDVSSFAESRLQERWKKHKKSRGNNGSKDILLQDVTDEPPVPDDSIMTWEKALEWMETRKLRPDPFGGREIVHVPLLQRSRGTTYEEKIEAALSGSRRRREKYEENVIKKRKTAEEDAAFYKHMTQQGGTGI